MEIRVKNAKICNFDNKEVKFFDLSFEVYDDASITIYGCRLIENSKGTFVAFPSHKGKDGKYYSHAYYPMTDGEIKIVKEQFDAYVGSANSNSRRRKYESIPRKFQQISEFNEKS